MEIKTLKYLDSGTHYIHWEDMLPSETVFSPDASIAFSIGLPAGLTLLFLFSSAIW